MLTEAFSYFIDFVLPRAWEILISPWLHPETLWLVLPLIFITLMVEVYFGRHRSEELGWNSAFGNSISLLWICVILFRFVFENNTLIDVASDKVLLQKTGIVAALMLWVLIIMIFEYLHQLPKRLAFLISASDSVYPMAYIIISIVLGPVALDVTTLYASMFLYLAILMGLYTFKHFIPVSEQSKKVLELRKQRKQEMESIKKRVRTRKMNEFIKSVKEKKRKIFSKVKGMSF